MKKDVGLLTRPQKTGMIVNYIKLRVSDPTTWLSRCLHSKPRLNGLWLLIPVIMFFISCKNDIETINALTTELKIPDQVAYDVETVFNDSGLMQGKILAPEINIYNNDEAPYTEFPQGMEVLFYDSTENVSARIQAGYAIYYQDEQLWEARNKVFAENKVEGATLETEQMFWNEKDQKIYSEKFSVITNADGVFYGQNGFDANQNLTNWTLRSSRGTANLRDVATPEE